MSSVRELLETAVPLDTRPDVPAAAVRARSRRRNRRNRSLGALVSLAVIVVVAVALLRAPAPAATRPAAPSPTPHASYSPQPDPSLTGTDFAALVGTRWVPDFAPDQVYPGDKGKGPRALLTFAPDHRLLLDYVDGGRTWTVRGTWAATSATPALDLRSRGGMLLRLETPADAPVEMQLLLSRISMVVSFTMFASDGPPPPLIERNSLLAYANNFSVLTLDQVKPGTVLPSPYPVRP